MTTTLQAKIIDNYVFQACDYVKNNPKGFNTFLHILDKLGYATANVNRDKVFMEAERLGVKVTDSQTFTRDHNLFSVLTRYAIMLDPYLIDCIHPRKSAIDESDLVYAWNKYANYTKDLLKIESWTEAREWVDNRLKYATT